MTFNLSELIEFKHQIYAKVKLTQDQREAIEEVFDNLVLDKGKNTPPIPTFPIPRGVEHVDYMYKNDTIDLPKFLGQEKHT